jgi:hypothetical protein
VAESVELPIEAAGIEEVIAKLTKLRAEEAAAAAAIEEASRQAEATSKAQAAAAQEAERIAAEVEAKAVARAERQVAAAKRAAAEISAAGMREADAAEQRYAQATQKAFDSAVRQEQAAVEASTATVSKADTSMARMLGVQVLTSAMGRLGDAFGETGRRATQAVGGIIAAGVAAGTTGGLLALLGATVEEGVREWNRLEAATKRALQAGFEETARFTAAFEASNVAIAEAIKGRLAAVALTEAQNFATKTGIGLDEAKLLVERQQLRERIESGQKLLDLDKQKAGNLGGASGEFEARQRELDALSALEKQKGAEEAAAENARAIERHKKANEEWMQHLIERGNILEARLKHEQQVQAEQAARSLELQTAADKRAADTAKKDAESRLAQIAKSELAWNDNRIASEKAFLDHKNELLKAANAEADEAISASIQKEAELQKQERAAAVATGGQLLELGLQFADSQQRQTKVQYEEAAKRALIQAAVLTAQGFADLAIPGLEENAPAAFIAAAQYAAIAGGNAIASAGASDKPSSSSASSGSSPSAGGTTSGSGPSGTATRGPTTIVIGSGGLLLTKADINKSVRAALNDGDRTK